MSAVSAALAAGLLLAGCATPLPAADPAPTATASADAATAAPSQAAVRALLSARAGAVLAGDPVAVARTEVPGMVSPVRDRATALPLAAWSYDSVELGSAVDGLVPVDASLSYRLAGDPADVRVPVRLALRASGSGWAVASERVAQDRPEPWELGDVGVVREGAAVVVAVGEAASSAARVARAAARAAAEVSATVGDAWGEPLASRGLVVVLVPSTVELARGLGRSAADLEGVGAVTAAAGATTDEQPVRVWASAEVAGALGDVELLVLLRHEAVHVAAGSVLAPGAPAWLVEGVAEEIGYGADVPLEVAAGPFLRTVAAQGPPGSLPVSADLSGSDLEVGYGAAHVAADLIVARHGLPALLRLYALVRDGSRGIDAALREVTGEGIDAFTASWRARALELAG